MTDTIEVTHTSWVRGFSKFILSAVPALPFTMVSLMKYESADAMIMTTRITKIQTSSLVCTTGSPTASRMKVMSATPVTP